MTLLVTRQQVTFGIIGIANTLLDLTVFHLLANVIGLPFVVANVISTSLALIMSFVLNAKFTFQNKVSRRNLLLFLIVTLTGLWVLQPIVIALGQLGITQLHLQLDPELRLLIAKLLATVVSLIWNFLLYKSVVFNDVSKK